MSTDPARPLVWYPSYYTDGPGMETHFNCMCYGMTCVRTADDQAM